MVPDYFNAELDLLDAVPLNQYPQQGYFLYSGFAVPRLELLELVAALLQQHNDTARSGEMKRACDNRRRFASFQFSLDSRNPFDVAIIDKASRDARCLAAQSRVTCPKRISIAFAPCLVHPAEFFCAIVRLS